MIKKINLPEAAKLTSPNPLSIICIEKTDGDKNTMSDEGVY